MTHTASTTVHTQIARPAHDVYELFIPINLVDILVGWGPLPAVVGTSDQTGSWSQTGSKRTVHLADGSTASEQVTHYIPDAEFGYTVSGFTNPIRLLARQAKGMWVFTRDSATSTHVTWTYTYEARGFLANILLTPIVKLLWKRYMQRAIDTFSALAEQKIRSL